MSIVAVVTSSPPFVEGGHLVMARSLVEELRRAGHEADLVVTPQNRFGRQGAAYTAAWLTDVGRTYDDRGVDRVISLRYPGYAVRHPHHVCWLNHTMREYYDRWDAFSAPLSWKGRIKERTRRRLVWAADRRLLTRNVRKLFVISRTVQQRLERWGGIPSDVLYPPAPPRPYRCDAYEPWLFAVSRFTPLKRMALIVEALAHPAAKGIRMVLAGEGEEQSGVADAIRRYGMADRVALAGRLSDDQLVDHLARCRGVVFAPLDEDYGFVTVEAFASGKPVLTTDDSGGPAELVMDGRNGLVCSADPSALAEGMRRLVEDEAAARRLGAAGRLTAETLSWPAAIGRLLAV
jgi:glycosyltransferase involved in cell wall biosynthesis